MQGDTGDASSIPGSGRSPGRGNGKPISVFLPGKSHEQRTREGYSPQSHKQLDMTKHAQTQAPQIREIYSGTPLQDSCLENCQTEEPSRLQSTGSQRGRHDRMPEHTRTRTHTL